MKVALQDNDKYLKHFPTSYLLTRNYLVFFKFEGKQREYNSIKEPRKT